MEVSMHAMRTLLLASLIALTAFPSSAGAQQRHVIDPGAMAQTVGKHAAALDADRAAVREALQRPEVQDVARQLGLDVTRLAFAASALEGTGLEQAAEAARNLDQAIVGGQNITFSATTIIIILLVVLLIVVAVD
jgi:hypothetical protein